MRVLERAQNCHDDFRDVFHDVFRDDFRESIESPPWQADMKMSPLVEKLPQNSLELCLATSVLRLGSSLL